MSTATLRAQASYILASLFLICHQSRPSMRCIKKSLLNGSYAIHSSSTNIWRFFHMSTWNNPLNNPTVENVGRRAKGTLNDFEQFILRGNVVDLAVGIIIGAAFGTV